MFRYGCGLSSKKSSGKDVKKVLGSCGEFQIILMMLNEHGAHSSIFEEVANKYGVNYQRLMDRSNSYFSSLGTEYKGLGKEYGFIHLFNLILVNLAYSRRRVTKSVDSYLSQRIIHTQVWLQVVVSIHELKHILPKLLLLKLSILTITYVVRLFCSLLGYFIRQASLFSYSHILHSLLCEIYLLGISLCSLQLAQCVSTPSFHPLSLFGLNSSFMSIILKVHVLHGMMSRGIERHLKSTIEYL